MNKSDLPICESCNSILNLNHKHLAEFYCGKCNSKVSKDISPKYYEFTYKEISEIINDAAKNKICLIKLIAIINYIENGNFLVLKNKNGQNNTAIIARIYKGKTEAFIQDLKQIKHIKKTMLTSEWINSFENFNLKSKLADELYNFGVYSGFTKKLNKI